MEHKLIEGDETVSLTKIQEKIIECDSRIEAAKQDYDRTIKNLNDERKDLLYKRQILLMDLNMCVFIAESILSVYGDISRVCEGKRLSDLAADDISKGCPHMRKEYFGNKRYEAFYQRSDHPYGYGPKHGSIVERVGLASDYQKATLTDEEKDACIYYLLNFSKIFEAKKLINDGKNISG